MLLLAFILELHSLVNFHIENLDLYLDFMAFQKSSSKLKPSSFLNHIVVVVIAGQTYSAFKEIHYHTNSFYIVQISDNFSHAMNRK